MSSIFKYGFGKFYVCVLAIALILPAFAGCGSAEVEKSPEDIEKSRQEHGAQSQRELDEG